MFRKKDKETKINWTDERYHPFSIRDIPQPGDALRPPRPTGVPHYNEWFKYRSIEKDVLIAAASCQFMDVRQGALSGRVFISVNLFMYIIEDRENPDRNIFGSYSWNDVCGWGLGVKELTTTHPFYRVNAIFTMDGANSVRIVTEGRKKKSGYYIHNITGITPSYFPTFVAMLDAIFRYHHNLPKPAGYELMTPPQVELDERSGVTTTTTGVSTTGTSSVAPGTQSQAPQIVQSQSPTTAQPPMMKPNMNSNMNMMGMNSGMMNPNMNMMSMNPSMMGMNPGMMNPMMMNPMMMQQMQQNPQMMMMMMQQMQQNPQMMMMMQQQNPQMRQQLMQTRVPSQAARPTPTPAANVMTTDNVSTASPKMNNGLNRTQLQPAGVVSPVGGPRPPLKDTQVQPMGVQAPFAARPAGQQTPQQERRPSRALPQPAAGEDEEFIVKKQKQDQKLVQFKLDVANITQIDEMYERLPSFPTFEWNRSPVRVIMLSQENASFAEELLASSNSGKNIIDFGESFARDCIGNGLNLDFGYPGAQVPVDTELKQKIILASTEPQKISFRVIKMKHLKYRVNAEPMEGTLSKGQTAFEIQLTLKMGCTTSVELEVPILFWHGSLKDYDKMVVQGAGVETKQVFVNYLRGKIQSQLSTRLDIEEVVLYKPPIGNGAFGTVYKGRYRGLDVACKLLKDQDDLTQEMFDDFRGEVRMFETLRHPCIVNFVGAVFFPGSLALVTELCQYGSLPSAMQKYGPKVWNTKMKIKAMFDCARAMDFLHQSSIIHRDLKPDNLLATSLEIHSPAVCKLSDFGTTKGANSMMRDMKMTKGIGTPLYMAPEMMRGTEGYTAKADVYSFGIMMASVTDNGKEPYEGDPRIQSSWQFTNLVIQGLRPRVERAAEMPPQFLSLMQRCWDPAPDVRPSFEQIVRELETMLADDE